MSFGVPSRLSGVACSLPSLFSPAGDFGRTGCLVPILALPRQWVHHNKSHALLKTFSAFPRWLFETSVFWLNRGIANHGFSFYRQAQPPNDFQHRKENQADDAQNIEPGSQVESLKHDRHIGMFPNVLCQERQSSCAKEEQHSGTTNDPSARLQHTVHPNFAIHHITTLAVRVIARLT